jgi:cyclophilin family peptidyl-prolyl cis-trans isomerase
VIQGGGFRLENGTYVDIAPAGTDTVDGEVGLSNLRGTIAMALVSSMTGTDPDSATSQWFINTDDNANLDVDFTVFGRVIHGMDVADAINDLDRISGQFTVDDPLAFNFGSLPVLSLPVEDPQGYGCAIVFPNPPQPPFPPGDSTACQSQEEFDASIAARKADLSPQVPDLLVHVERAVLPEPGAEASALALATALAAAARARRG